MNEIEPSHDNTFGWTPDKFTGYLYIIDKTVWIKVIQSLERGRGNFRTLLDTLKSQGYTIKIVDPMRIMEMICIHYNMIPSVENFDGSDSIIWTMKR